MASLPSTSEEERKRLLSFVVCGGGPTGVETAAVRPPVPTRALFAQSITRKSLICAKKTLLTTWVPFFLFVLCVNSAVTNFSVSENMSGTGFHSCHPVPGTHFKHCALPTRTWSCFLIFILHSTLKQYRNLRRLNSNVTV